MVNVKLYSYLLEPCDDGLLCTDLGEGDLDLDFESIITLASTSGSLSFCSSLSDFSACPLSSPDLESTSESESVEVPSSVSVLDLSPETTKHRNFR